MLCFHSNCRMPYNVSAVGVDEKWCEMEMEEAVRFFRLIRETGNVERRRMVFGHSLHHSGPLLNALSLQLWESLDLFSPIEQRWPAWVREAAEWSQRVWKAVLLRDGFAAVAAQTEEQQAAE